MLGLAVANIIFLDNSFTEHAHVTTNSEAERARAANLVHPQPSHAWESAALAGGDPVIYVEGPDSGLDGVFLGWFNMQDGADVYYAVANTQNLVETVPEFQSGAINFWPQPNLDYAYSKVGYSTWYRFPTTRTESWLRIYLDDTANPDGVLRGGIVHAGRIHEPNIPMSFGGSHGYVDPSEISYTEAGSMRIAGRPGWDESQCPLNFANEDDALMFYQLYKYVGHKRPVFMHLNLDDTTYGYSKWAYGKIDMEAIVQPEFDIYQVVIHVHGMER